MALEVVVAIVLLLLIVIFVPRQDIRIADARFVAGPCDSSSETFPVTAFVTLVNRGGADGHVFVRFFVDGELRATTGVFVAAGSTLERTLSASIAGCSSRPLYFVDTYIPSGG